VTAHSRAGEALDLDWANLADAQSTLAFYMGRAAAPEISRELIAHGLPASTPVLIACDVSMPEERRMSTRLDLLPLTVNAVAGDRPTLILVGAAVAPSRQATRRTARASAES
jgi:uroporphyrin-III C-methyltransferase